MAFVSDLRQCVLRLGRRLAQPKGFEPRRGHASYQAMMMLLFYPDPITPNVSVPRFT